MLDATVRRERHLFSLIFLRSYLDGRALAKSENEKGFVSVSGKTGLSISGGGGSMDKK